MTLSHPVVTLKLLGVPSLVVGQQERLLERKAAGVLAFVCLEGPVTRGRLAGLLWPNVPEGPARTNLRQVLWRLRSYGDALVVGNGMLTLSASVQVDVTQFRIAALQAGDLDQPAWASELLADKEFSDCPAFEEWLLAEREQHRALRRDALWRLTRAHQDAGNLEGALRGAARLLELDPLSEPAYRLVMTLHVSRGDRAAALATFRDGRDMLRRELGVPPMPETLALADEIRQVGTAWAPPSPTESAAWHPPLTGREGEWARLHAALDAGQLVLVGGPPGMGKTRLLREVLRARGPVLCLEPRPNDEAVPYLALGRLARQLVQAHREAAVHPGAPGPLEDWVRAEAAHLLPDLWPGGPGPDPLASETAQRRFLEAMTRLVTSLLPLALAAQPEGAPGPGSLLFDDDQWTDERSWEAWRFIFSQPEWRALGVQVGLTFRQGELSFVRREALERLVEGGAALRVDLRPLDEVGVGTLTRAFLDHQGAPAASRVAASVVEALQRHTGGNPLFVLETLRSLQDAGRLTTGEAQGKALPVPPQLEPLLRRRLERLSDPALRLARVVAVAGSDFDADLAAHVLRLTPLDLVQPWVELEAAQIIRGTGFAHDLIAQAARQSVPQPLRALLHANVAGHLEARTGPFPRVPAPEHVALHWEAAGKPLSAAPHWVRAGWVALGRGAWRDAALDFRRAMTTADPAQGSVAEAQYGLGLALRGQDPSGAEEALLGALSRVPGPRRTVELEAALAELYRLCGRLEDALSRIKQATELAGAHLTAPEQAELWRVRFAVHLRAGQYSAAEAAILQAQALAPGRREIVNEHALLLWMAGRLVEAARLYESFRTDAEAEQAAPTWYAGNLGWTYWALGRLTEAETVLAAPLGPAGSPFDLGVRQVHRATVSISQGRYHKALQELDAAEPALAAYPPHMVDLWHRRGVLLIYAARPEEAAPLMARAVTTAQEIGDPVRLSLALSGLTHAHTLLGQQAEAERWAAELRHLALHVQVPLTQVVANHALALLAGLEGSTALAAGLADEAVRLARACDMTELLARSLLLRGALRRAQGTGDLLEAAALAEVAGIPDAGYHAARLLSGMDPAWRPRADELYLSLRSQAPPGFLDDLPRP